ncbi:hypothetical protein [Pseudarthrobacter sp. NS4]|uniref:hypothetical protein n=1 Tax=Pseudarthrobacter sp. NS4 TaxID=2973976 RepID=UPI002161818B|nr:hypothetical protein [Pseudarthrobacter sp. NS4]
MAMTSKAGVLIAGSALVAGLLTGCGEQTVVEEAQEAGPTAEAAILGETVTLQAEVQDIIGPNSFTVGDDTLVLGEGITEGLEDGEQVQVTGTVRSFVKADVERDYGLDFNDDEDSFVVEYEQDLAVVADKVQKLP